MYRNALLTLAASASAVVAYDLPDNLRALYETHLAKSCDNPLSSTFTDGAVYCSDIPSAVFLQGGPGSFDNLDIDCDGVNNAAGDCANDPTGQSQTAFRDIAQGYGIEDLDANLHSYVVFGNEGDDPSFSPLDAGMEPLSVMAVVCGGQVFYGVWGDTNGGTLTGETSLALGKLCFPDEGLNGNFGHGEKDVLYIGFTGSGAVPGGDGAVWSAGSAEEFQESIRSLGESLVAGL